MRAAAAHEMKLLAFGYESFLPIERVEVFDFDEIEIGFAGAVEKADDLGVGDRPALRLAHEACAPVVGTEGLFEAVGVDLGAAIGQGEHLEATAVEGFEFLAEFNRVAVFGIEEDIYPDKFFLLRRVNLQSLMQGFVGFSRISDGFELLGLLAHVSYDCFSEFFGTDFLFADAFLKDVVSVYAFF